jgi:hypothetical protein
MDSKENENEKENDGLQIPLINPDCILTALLFERLC